MAELSRTPAGGKFDTIADILKKRKVASFEDRVRRARKPLDRSLRGLIAELQRERGTFSGTVTARGVAAAVRVIIRARHTLPESWAMSILLNNERIDGIDWEARVDDHRGKAFNCKGWHRHIWKATSSAHKECLPSFCPKSLDEFIQNGFALLNVELKREEVGNGDGLLFS